VLLYICTQEKNLNRRIQEGQQGDLKAGATCCSIATIID
jgi:hypothetical protein